MTSADKKVAVLLTADGKGTQHVLPDSLQEVAELIGCTRQDLTVMHYSESATMWMSRRAQLDPTMPSNKDATMVLHRFNGIPALVRGDVVSFPHGTWFPAKEPVVKPRKPRGRAA